MGYAKVMVTADPLIVRPGLRSGYGRGIVEVYYRQKSKESDER